MNITQFIKYLNQARGWNLESSYYGYVDEWRDWWRGWRKAFHEVRELGLDENVHTRKMRSMRMPKRVCEDWASLLLNDKTMLSLGDKNTADWLLGKECQQTGGILGGMEFWKNANRLVELAMRSGTGAFVLCAEGMCVKNGAAVASPDTMLCMDYLPAECILPITVRHGKIVDVAFASEVISGGKSCIYLQTHLLTGTEYCITNEYFTSKHEDSDSAVYEPAPLPAGMAKSFTTGSAVPWFSILTPNIVSNLSGGRGLGMAVFAEAIDQAMQCDIAFDNYHNDLFLGGKKVFYNKRLLKTYHDKDGKAHQTTPDQVRQQLFWQTNDEDPDATADWHEYNPDLRVDDNGKAVQDALDYFSFKCGLGTHHYQFNAGNIATATQYHGDRQDLVQHANKHQINVESALIGIVRAILWAGKLLCGAPVVPDTSITVLFDDSYISDAQTRRAQDKDDALGGFIPKYRYNMEWRGMSEEDARRAVSEAEAESGAQSEAFGFGGGA